MYLHTEAVRNIQIIINIGYFKTGDLLELFLCKLRESFHRMELYFFECLIV